ncbi:MAG: ABC transporter permease [Gemmatimonadaceae bacterium]
MSWIGRLLRRRAMERDLDKELRFHLDEEARRHTAVGVDPREAERRARIALGGLEQTKESTRDARGTRWLEDIGSDVRYAVRALRRTPVFTASAILTLAVGIGANTAVFNLTDAVLLRTLPVLRPNELVAVKRVGLGDDNYRFSHPSYERLRHAMPDTTAMAAMSSTLRMWAMIGDAPEATIGQLVSGEWFGVLGVRPAMGRLIDPSDNRDLGGHPVAVLSHAYWDRRFGRSPSVIGSTLRVNGVALTVIGVAAPRFFGMKPGDDVDLYAPLVMQHELRYQSNASVDNADGSKPWIPQIGIAWLTVIARAAPDQRAQVESRLERDFRGALTDEVASREEQVRTFRMREHVRLEPAGRGLSDLRKDLGAPMLTLMASVGLVLLIACANLASLLLARTTARSQELSIRASLGARSGRLIRQGFTESLTLALIGGVCSLLVARWGSVALLHLLTSNTNTPSQALQLTFEPRLLAFAFGLSLLVGVLFGVAPALRIGHADLHAVFKTGGRVVGARHGNRFPLGRVLVAGQIALSLALVVLATLFARTLRNFTAIDPGFDQHQVAEARIDVRAAGYAAERLPALNDRLIEAVRAVPRVRSVSVSVTGVATGHMRTSSVEIPGQVHGPEWDGTVQENTVTPAFFETVGLSLMRGRGFTASDATGAPPVAVVSQSMARYFFGTEEAIGRRFSTGDSAIEVIGVVRDARVNTIKDAPPRMAYYPLAQVPSEYPNGIEVRFDGPAVTVIPLIRAAIASVDRALPVREIVTLDELLGRGLREQSLVSQLAGLFSILALLLASIGLYGVMAYTVAQRSTELGVRLALGAKPAEVRGVVLRDTLRIVVIGLVAGAVILIPSLGAVESLVYGVSPRDPATLAAAAALLLLVGTLAGFVPAWRASRIDPARALRAE